MLKLIVVLAAGTYNYNSHQGVFDMLQTTRTRNRRCNVFFIVALHVMHIPAKA